MSKSKCNIRVLSSKGAAFTTKRGARRLVDRGLATEIPGGVQMIETDPRFCAEISIPRGPQLNVVAFRAPLTILEPHGFLRYPHLPQTTFRRLNRAA